MISETAQAVIRSFSEDNAQYLRDSWGRDGRDILAIMQRYCGVEAEHVSTIHFDQFWDAYPPGKRKVDKRGCFKLWQRDRLDEQIAPILKALKLQRADDDWTKSGGNYIPMPSVYLNQQRWMGIGDEMPGSIFDGGV